MFPTSAAAMLASFLVLTAHGAAATAPLPSSVLAFSNRAAAPSRHHSNSARNFRRFGGDASFSPIDVSVSLAMPPFVRDDALRRREGMTHLRMSDSPPDEPTEDIEKDFDVDVGDGGTWRSVLTLVAVQSVLIPLSIGLASLLNVANGGLGPGFAITANSILEGIKWTAPLVAFAAALHVIEPNVQSLQDVTRATQRSVLALLGRKRRPIFALLSSILLGFAAGVGEEWLFRGVAQSALSSGLGLSDVAAVGLASVVFGLLHAVTPAYAALATGASVFFGWLYLSSGNLAVPIACHAIYDVAALMWAHWSVTDPNMTEEDIEKIMQFGGPVDDDDSNNA